MKTAKIFSILILTLLFVPFVFAKEDQKSQTSGIKAASCVIRIALDRKEMLLQSNALSYVRSVLQSSGVGLRAAREFMDFQNEANINDVYLSPGNLDQFINVNYISEQLVGNDVIYTFKLSISDLGMSGQKANAPAFMKAIVEGLKKELYKSYEDYKKRMEQQLRIAEENAKNAEKEFYALQEQMRKISGTGDLSRRKVLADINSLQDKIENQQLSIALNEAELENLSNQINVAMRRANEKLKNDTVLIELENFVKVAQKALDSIKQEVEVGRGSKNDLVSAEEKLSRAKVEVGRRKEELQSPSGTLNIDALNEKIAAASSRQNSYMKSLKNYQRQVAETQENIEKSDEYEVLSIKSDIAKSSLRNALQNLADLKRNADIVPPTITVMGD